MHATLLHDWQRPFILPSNWKEKNKLIWHLKSPPLWIMYHCFPTLQPPPSQNHHYSALSLWFSALGNTSERWITGVWSQSAVISVAIYLALLKQAFIHCLLIKCNGNRPSVKLKKMAIFTFSKMCSVSLESQYQVYGPFCFLPTVPLFTSHCLWLWSGCQNNSSLTIITCTPRSQ